LASVAVSGGNCNQETPRNTGRNQEQSGTKIHAEILGTDWEQNRQKNHKKRKTNIKNF